MNDRGRKWAEQALFALTIFALFLVVIEDKIVVPVWLQPVGRMHPLLLHFPIVILLLAMVMEVFRFNATYAPNESNSGVPDFYRAFLTNLLLVGALSAGVTVVMGLFLSKEEGYAGNVLQWHKWTGVGLFLLSSLIYWGRNKSWYQATVAKVGALATVVLLISAGHFGATLTHGDNFIAAPIMNQHKAAPVTLDQALVFDHVIQPIFEQKCVSCHNPDKLKGELNLTDAAAMLKGGKTGRLFVAGKPEISLLLKRLHLPEEEKKHMPPVGKPQLTSQEIKLLSLWVREKARFKGKVIDLPVTDSLRMLASARFTPAESAGDEYDFGAADDETIKTLTNDYRTIAPIAKGSPALAVNLYNKAAYSPEKIGELSDISKQVVSLNLTKLPVKDADLKQVSQFENLQKLELNFTDITGNGLSVLTSLKHLNSLAIAGTNVAYPDLAKSISAFKSLKTLAVWNTRLSAADIERLQKANKTVRFIAGFSGAVSKPIRLNPPQVKNSSTIFSQSLTLQLKHPIKGVQIRYTTDGTEPDSLTSPLYTEGTALTGMTTVKAKAYKSGWFGSTIGLFNFYKSAYRPDSVRLLLPLNPVHQADGAHTFFDGKLGTFNANSPAWANNWGGFKKNDMALVSEFKKPVQLTSVALRIMVEEETGIFPPEVVQIWGGRTEGTLKLLATLKPDMPVKKSTPELKTVTCTVKSQPVSYLKIIAKPLSKLPDWHANKGKGALLLVDEVFIN